jgi:hypothetical protein
MAGSPAQYEQYYRAASSRYGIPENVLKGQDYIESGFNPAAASSAGAKGISQFIPSTAASYGVHFGTSPSDVQSQIMGQAQYMQALGYTQNPKLALAKYNAGPGNPGAGMGYAANVLAAAKNYGGGSTAGIPVSLQGVSPIKAGAVSATQPTVPNALAAVSGIESARESLMGGGPMVGQAGQANPIQQGWQALSNLWQSQQQPTQQTQAGSQAPRVVGAGVGFGTKGDVNPLRHFTLGRTDMGVDANARPGTPILAPNTSKVVGIIPNWYSGQPYVEMQILDGPNAGKLWYVAEQITNIPHKGQTIPKGQAVAYYAPSGTGIEIGWAEPKATSSLQTLAQATGQTGSATHADSPAGKSFMNYLRSLGA